MKKRTIQSLRTASHMRNGGLYTFLMIICMQVRANLHFRECVSLSSPNEECMLRRCLGSRNVVYVRESVYVCVHARVCFSKCIGYIVSRLYFASICYLQECCMNED